MADTDELSRLLYEFNIEHLIQDEPNYGFCETCQEMADWKCHRYNRDLPKLKSALEALIANERREAKIEELREIPVHPNFIGEYIDNRLAHLQPTEEEK